MDAIGSRLVGNLEDNEFTFKFGIVDQFDPNAFALPGGWVYVSRGLMVLANNEDELAILIGHEITHITERHSASRQRRGILGRIAQIPGNVISVVVSEDLGKLINSPLNTVSQVRLAKYSRGQENEADRLGMRLAARSGYDPSALANILERLEADVEMLTVEARNGESLAQLGERTGNRWTPEYTALINDLAVHQPLEAGTLVKIARRERYRPQ